MSEHVIVDLAAIVVLGTVAQWAAWRLRLPSILALLLTGFLAGPLLGALHPDKLLGELLFPLVSLAVGIIMFEGGLTLKLSELAKIGRTLRNLIAIGALITWVLGAAAAYFILRLDLPLSVLLGAILVVTGPTVIGPLLRFIRPTGRSASLLRWEGILIDPVGATLALLVFEVIRAADLQQATLTAALVVVRTLLVGFMLGGIGAGLMVLLLRRYWVPDYLQNPFTLMAVVGVFALSDVLQSESGLLSVTVMGIALANQRQVSIKHIVEFKETVTVLIIATLFILLAARLRMEDLAQIGLEHVLFVAVMMLIVRPLSIWTATIGSGLEWRDKLFLSWMAPRGIVAAAVSSLFGLKLAEVGHAQAEQLVPAVFTVIIGTVAVYGLTARPLAIRLGLARANPQGVLIVGAHRWARAIGKALHSAGFPVTLADTNWANVRAARMDGLRAHYGSVLSEHEDEQLPLDGIGRLLALTSNDEVNTLAVQHFTEVFGRAETYQLALRGGENQRVEPVAWYMRGRALFGEGMNFNTIDQLIENGAVIKTTPLTRTFDFDNFKAQYNGAAVPLFVLDPRTQTLTVATNDQPVRPQPGQSLVSLVREPAPEAV